MTELVKNELKRFVDYISSMEEVRKIYLFGSQAYGRPRDDSDIDLYITVLDEVDKLKTGIKMEAGLFDRKTALDIVINWDSEFETASESATLQREVKQKGVLLYEQ